MTKPVGAGLASAQALRLPRPCICPGLASAQGPRNYHRIFQKMANYYPYLHKKRAEMNPAHTFINFWHRPVDQFWAADFVELLASGWVPAEFPVI